MRKQGIWITVGVAVVTVICLAAFSRRPDELDFLRQYPHREIVIPSDGDWASVSSTSPLRPLSSRLRWLRFTKAPEDLLNELERRVKKSADGLSGIDLPSGREAKYYVSEGDVVFVVEEPPPTWLAQQWAGTKRRLGIKEPSAADTINSWGK